MVGWLEYHPENQVEEEVGVVVVDLFSSSPAVATPGGLVGEGRAVEDELTGTRF